MQRQDSVTDQLATVAAAAEQVGLSTVVAWIRGGGPKPTNDQIWLARKLAVGQGCYDADDWLSRARDVPST